MRKGSVVLLAAALVVAFALPAMADVSFFGSARVIPTYYKDFDFDSNKGDAPTLNEGGIISGEHIRSELRLGWKAGGDKWKISMIAESDMIWNKNNADRSYYTNSVFSATNTIPISPAKPGQRRIHIPPRSMSARVASGGAAANARWVLRVSRISAANKNHRRTGVMRTFIWSSFRDSLRSL